MVGVGGGSEEVRSFPSGRKGAFVLMNAETSLHFLNSK